MTLKHYLTVIALLLPLGCGRDVSPRKTSNTPTAIAEATPTNLASTPVNDRWPFDDAKNTAVITLTRILNGSRPILYVVHEEDGGWRFLDGADVSEADAATVALKNIADHDPSVKSLADLPVGWAAERTGVGQEWQRFQR